MDCRSTSRAQVRLNVLLSGFRPQRILQNMVFASFHLQEQSPNVAEIQRQLCEKFACSRCTVQKKE